MNHNKLILQTFYFENTNKIYFTKNINYFKQILVKSNKMQAKYISPQKRPTYE